MFRYAVGRSGGLLYHLKAFRRASCAWAPFHARVRLFLEKTWAPSESELIVFGPSAGWTLPLDWLSQKFDRLVFIEPDPIARALLKRKFPRAEFDSSSERLPWFCPREQREASLRVVLDRHPRAAILFANVLGQIKLLADLSEKEDEDCRRIFLSSLAGRNWASYHDRLSSKAPFISPSSDQAPQARDPESLARHFFALEFARVELVDHDTAWLGEDRNEEFCTWPLDRNSNHLISFVS